MKKPRCFVFMEPMTFYSIDKGTHLETGSWLFEDNEIRKIMLKWLEERENIPSEVF